jgi:hypothetical protein
MLYILPFLYPFSLTNLAVKYPTALQARLWDQHQCNITKIGIPLLATPKYHLAYRSYSRLDSLAS